MKRPLRAIRWMVWEVGEWALIYFGVFVGIAWAGNVLRFYVWATVPLSAMLALYVVVLASDDAHPDDLRDLAGKPAVPPWLTVMAPVAAALTLAAAGWFATAGAFLFTTLVSALALSWARQYVAQQDAAIRDAQDKPSGPRKGAAA